MLKRIAKLLKFQPPVYQNAGLLFGSGDTVPVDGAVGWQTGAIFQHTDGTESTAIYVNEGTYTACDFDPMGTTTQSGNWSIGSLTASTSATIGTTLLVSGATTLAALLTAVQAVFGTRPTATADGRTL